jgi:5-methylcytosine-specific restriction endonuclease McrA
MKTCPLCGNDFLFLNENGICDHCQTLIKANRLSKEKAIWLRDGKRCRYCGKELSLREKTIDHFVPKSRGGTSDFANLVTACRECNQKKGRKILAQENVLHIPQNFFRRF